MWSIWALDLNFKAPNQSCMPLVVKKNGNMWETFPTEGGRGHLFPTQLFSLGPELWFFGEDQKCSWGSKMKNKPNFFFDNRGFPNWRRPLAESDQRATPWLQPALLCQRNMKVRIQRNTLYEMSPKWEEEVSQIGGREKCDSSVFIKE